MVHLLIGACPQTLAPRVAGGRLTLDRRVIRLSAPLIMPSRPAPLRLPFAQTIALTKLIESRLRLGWDIVALGVWQEAPYHLRSELR